MICDQYFHYFILFYSKNPEYPMSVYFVNLGVLTEKRFIVYRRGAKSRTEMLELYWIGCSSKAVEYSTILILFFFNA